MPSRRPYSLVRIPFMCRNTLYYDKKKIYITGITIANLQYKRTQFTDDTTVILDGSQTSLTSSLNTLEVFGSLFGLKMNSDKTKFIWIGRMRSSKDKLNTEYNLIWGEDEFDLLGLTFNTNLNLTTLKNYQKAIVKMKRTRIRTKKNQIMKGMPQKKTLPKKN